MRIKTLIATSDTAYTNHISGYISEHHADAVEISVCNTVENLREMLKARRYDVALMDDDLIKAVDVESVKLPLLLGADIKHRRISKTISDVLEKYAAVSGKIDLSGERTGKITAVWSPAGGVGKTTVALACAACAVAEEKEVFYLNLETFSSQSAYFTGNSKSISSVFEMIEAGTGNTAMLVQGICCMDNGIKFLCPPENFDDMCILSAENIHELVVCCAAITDELIIDLSSVCDVRTKQIFELADKILIVTDKTPGAQHKLTQFISQSNVYESIREKIILTVNKAQQDTINISEEALYLPYIDSSDVQVVYKSLAVHV